MRGPWFLAGCATSQVHFSLLLRLWAFLVAFNVSLQQYWSPVIFFDYIAFEIRKTSSQAYAIRDTAASLPSGTYFCTWLA
jgi:hypothetical protein